MSEQKPYVDDGYKTPYKAYRVNDLNDLPTFMKEAFLRKPEEGEKTCWDWQDPTKQEREKWENQSQKNKAETQHMLFLCREDQMQQMEEENTGQSQNQAPSLSH
jgi:hypothetical protein